MRYVGYVACMEKGFVQSFVPDTRTEKYHLEDPGIEGWITLKNIFKKHDGGQGLDTRHAAVLSKHDEIWV